MNITLRAGERLYLNGAVIRVNRKVTIELLNDATFLLESHIMQATDAVTPLRQIYFAVQVMLMDPVNAEPALKVARDIIDQAMHLYQTPNIVTSLKTVSSLVESTRYFESLKILRGLFSNEHQEMQSDTPAAAVQAA